MAVTSEQWTPGSQILHRKTKRVKLNRTKIVSSKLANGKKVVNHLWSNKNIRKIKRTRNSAHRGHRKTSPIANHDGGGTGRRGRAGGRNNTSIRRGVVRGTGVSNPLHRWCQLHSAEGLSQSRRISPPGPGRRRTERGRREPPYRPGRRLASQTRSSVGRRGGRPSEHGQGLVLSSGPTSRRLEGPHRDTP